MTRVICQCFLFLVYLRNAAHIWCIELNATRQGETTTYTAAVYEHVAFDQGDPTKILTRQQALGIMMDNLNIYEKQAEIASTKNASIIVFPESGLYGIGHSRESIYPYLEEVTDAGISKNIPCDDVLFPPVQRYLSCIAKNNSIYVVANMGDVRICDKPTSPLCPDDGRFQFSTNIVYDNQGKQVALYHKRHLFNESRFDPAPLAEHSTFKTHFGKFATIIHEDIFFNDTAVYLWWNYKINSVAITSAARNELPYTLPVVAHRGFSMLFLYNVLSAGLRDTNNLYGGSGLFSENCGVYYLDMNNTEGQLLTFNLPVKANSSKPCGPYSYHSFTNNIEMLSNRNQNVSQISQDRKVFKSSTNSQLSMIEDQGILSPNLNTSDDSHIDKEKPYNEDWTPMYVINFKGMIQNDSFTMAPLTEHNNVLQVCQSEDHCCSLYYNFKSNPDNELYVLGAYMGQHHHGAAMFVRLCVLLKCRTQDIQSCGEPVSSATTTFDKIWLTSAADTIFMLPYVVTVSSDGKIGLGLEEFTYLPANFSSINGFRDPVLSITLLETYYDPY